MPPELTIKRTSKPEVTLAGIIEYYPAEYQAHIKEFIPDFREVVMIRAYNEVEVKAADDGDVVLYLSTRNLDLQGDIVTPGGWDLDLYKTNPKGLWSHEARRDPIYKANWTKPDAMGLKQSITFAPTDEGQSYKLLVDGGFLKTFSAGFRSLKSIWKGEDEFTVLLAKFQKEWPEFKRAMKDQVDRIITEKMLIESSLVNIPANPFAMVQAIKDKKISICEAVQKALHVEEYIKKGVDTGEIDKKYARATVTVTAKPVDVKSVITEVKQPVTIKEVVTVEGIHEMVEKNLKKTIAKRRGAV